MTTADVKKKWQHWFTALNWNSEAVPGVGLLTGEAVVATMTREQPGGGGGGVPMIGYWESSLKNLSTEQRTVFTVFSIMVMVMAIFGNIVTIITNLRRKQRHLLRVCLLSLAFSDIAFVTVTSIVYLSQFNTEFNSLWTLGELMCTFSPFLQTMAVLVNSITLVAIALDRYMAVVRLMKGSWKPNGWFCATCAVLIWGLGAGISSPMLTLYEVFDIVVLTTDSLQPNAVISGYYMAEICATDKAKNSYYFAIVFTAIFLPLLLAFGWLNGVIAKQIWIRRNPIAARQPPPPPVAKDEHRGPNPKSTTICASSSDRKTLSTNVSTHPIVERRTPASVFVSKCTCPQHNTGPEGPSIIDSGSVEPRAAPPAPQPANEASMNRRKRQLRTFKTIIVLMLVFFVCRLPMWIFLLIKMIGVANTNAYWNLHYSFGILAMLNGVLNPLMYTFLGETIRFTQLIKAYCVRVWVQPCRNGLQKVRRTRTGGTGGDDRAGLRKPTKERDSGHDKGNLGDAGIYMGD
ncbi:neuropeptide Y receptor type 5 [Anopheles aquasalis]|uniref:neuropeptide Y receptor type 5 n=1 Tax=Anopheles aquasalis TaxID=42839 RepID=UPI00215A5B4B|nr:neuropeptide Y receptor type 5 [Anopheles aquasalis]